MTASELVLLGLVVAAAVVAGYFLGRWSADRDLGRRSAGPSPLPAPGDVSGDDLPEDAPVVRAPSRQRGTPPPASAGGDYGRAETPAPARPRSTPPPASAGGDTAGSPDGDSSPAPRPRRGAPPPAAAGVMGPGDTGRKR